MTPRRRPPTATGSIATSPAVGVFQPRTELKPGTRVRNGDRLGAVDMLGIPQEVVAPADGILGASLVEAGQAVEYGQELIVIELAARAGRPERGLMFKKILIANRGEIALRVLRACRTLGIEAVVAYSEADRDSLPVQLADEAICIGPADARRSYLSAPAVISAAIVTGCDAIHPGYGFLSEDEGFAEVVRAHDLTFIGPPANVLERFASKESTRRLLGIARACPRSRARMAILRDDAHALAEGEQVGYPLLIKPAAGGGGKGMRMVRTPRELEAALNVCRSEARAAFGDESLYLERWLDETRHVEVQVAVDRYGRGIHLGERDCSVQRRHQKILEEGPTPALSAGGPRRARHARRPGRRVRRLRERRDARVPRRPRGQLLLHRDQLPDPGRAPGHGDAHRDRPRRAPRSGSRPASRSGSASRTSSPAATRSSSGSTPRTRRPSSARQPASSSATSPPVDPACGWTPTCSPGYEVPPFYDSLLGKLIVWGPTREAAIDRGRVALGELVVEGIVTNVAIHQALLSSEAFLEGRMTTNLLDRVGSAAFLAAAARS